MKIGLNRKYNVGVGSNALRRLMAANNLQSAIRRKRRKSIRQIGLEKLTADNILKRDFFAPLPGRKYVTDITYIPIRNSMVYFSVILDLFNGEIVSHKISRSADAALSTDVVSNLALKRDLEGAVLHSDQGVHYTNKAYQSLLKEKGIIASMSRKGNCWDNAMAENFFSHYKCECIRLCKKSLYSFESVVEVTEEYLNFYNKERYQSRLKNMSPIDYRLQNFKN